MKYFFAFFLLSGATAAFALPYTCESIEQNDERPAMRFRINDKLSVNQNGRNWKLHVVGVTSETGDRKIVYGSGSINERHIHLSFVKQGYVIGKVEAYSLADGSYEGDAFIRDVNGGKYTNVRCTK